MATLTLDLGGVNGPWPFMIPPEYLPLRFSRIRDTTFAVSPIIDTPADYGFRAPADGWYSFEGILNLVLDSTQPPPPGGPNFTFRVFKNGAPGSCVDGTGIDPVGANVGYPQGGCIGNLPAVAGLWWIVWVPIAIKVKLNCGDMIRFGLWYSTNSAADYIDGNPAHTRLHISGPF